MMFHDLPSCKPTLKVIDALEKLSHMCRAFRKLFCCHLIPFVISGGCAPVGDYGIESLQGSCRSVICDDLRM